MNALHEQFIAEARDLVHQAVDDLIVVEREGVTAERIDRIFRALHTLKGSAGVVQLPAMILTLHAAEDLLTAVNNARLGVTSAVVDQMLACLDQISHWVDDFEADGALPIQAGEQAQEMSSRLRSSASGDVSREPSQADRHDAQAAEHHALPGWVARLMDEARVRISRLAEQPTALVAVSYEPRAGCFFDGDDPIDLMRRMPGLLAFHVEARDPWPPIAELDPFACNLRLQGIAAAMRAELSSIFRLVPDQVRIIDIPEQALLRDGSDASGLARAIIEEQRKVLTAASDDEDRVGRMGAAARVAANALRHLGRTDLALQIEQVSSEGPAGSLVALLDRILASLTSSEQHGEDGQASKPGAFEPGTGPAAARSIRVDETRIDMLFNLTGELIVAKNSFAHLARRIEAEIGGNDLARAVRREQEVIERLAGDLHAAVLQLRMVPVAQVFQSFPRPVRDMARQLNKRVALVTEGETTESDKAIVDRLFEPLMHLVRNAVDHGIEAPEQRRAAGKPETGTVTIRASRASDRFVVEVSDDGRGIDPDIVRRGASERSLLTADELAALSNEQVLDLVFSAGFSTAAQVSDISGRGVGMDVVRTALGQIGGRVSLTSGVGTGTRVRLDLPMSIAMTRVMVVETGGQVLGIPMDGVTETVRLTPDRISQIKSNDGFVLRDRIVPICALADLMSLPRQPAPDSGVRLLIVVDTGTKIAAIEVDAIRDRLEVVLKPMQGLLANARGYAGTTLLGDGRVLLVLDLKEIVP